MNEDPATEVDRAALETVKKLGMIPVAVHAAGLAILVAQPRPVRRGAAAFEELTLGRIRRQLKMQVPDAWPNIFRQSRFLSAVDFVQADRLRRKVAREMERVFERWICLLVPALRGEILTITNFTGHPCADSPDRVRGGGRGPKRLGARIPRIPCRPSTPRRVPHGVCLIGRLFDEGTIGTAGIALERASGVAGERPPGF